MAKFTLGLLSLLVLISGLFAVLFVTLPRYFGAYHVENVRGLIDVAVLAAATFAGVVSNAVYDRIISRKSSRGILRKRDVILASVVAPVVMLPIYQSLQAGADVGILLLTSYQNGFFFNTLFSKLGRAEK